MWLAGPQSGACSHIIRRLCPLHHMPTRRRLLFSVSLTLIVCVQRDRYCLHQIMSARPVPSCVICASEYHATITPQAPSSRVETSIRVYWLRSRTNPAAGSHMRLDLRSHAELIPRVCCSAGASTCARYFTAGFLLGVPPSTCICVPVALLPGSQLCMAHRCAAHILTPQYFCPRIAQSCG